MTVLTLKSIKLSTLGALCLLAPTGLRGGIAGRSRQDWLIVPGYRVDKLRIGDTRQAAISSQSTSPGVWKDGCGEVLRWSTTSKTGIVGTLTARLKNGLVVQIDSANSTFHTIDGITADTSPELVRSRYKGLRAYMSDITDMALGEKPVVYWLDARKGIAFEFAYFPEERRRYLYAVIVFERGGRLCPEGNEPDPQYWHEIAPYSLDAPDQSAKLLPGGPIPVYEN